MRAEPALALGLVLLTALLLADAWQLGPVAGRVPVLLLVPTLLLLLVQLGRDLRFRPRLAAAAPLAAELRMVGWLAALVAAVLLLGVPLAVGAFLAAWLRRRARLPWWQATAAALAAIATLRWGLPLVMAAPLPAGWLRDWLWATGPL